ncbi:MAG: gliding motility-associated ABC transporter permease subunit GldF [Cryomorphaceae bacterium BACL7 MAG-120910-bin2]|jgi:ABC-2 type transport system permease protein|nr:MAG: gliding motility-associated ABC transporter permease subunit GldF [Cryomorphaceae bacterium BACL7 MAG-120910-bin2]KRO68856.1 MAG: gliding motility-associated ABC transporter permease subunit GldF [Cryomorphaceae bacterium BACL7 MAG-120322-bin74]KRO82277.1 MAG: gliding motility-associated ABC transporter permease subunit GldF [Cryomorphaceae bacterium BACL7 MAG-121220-bin83]NQW25245.1 gliding motility-associated ABC transporter permease subunit GldF [Cryomorphaceae bacterium]|tara:strand:- start:1455 stop:2186 length:732 start_codon:yes stop_codon:yes gene_type:complete
MWALAKKEFHAFFQSATGVLILCVYLGLNGAFLWLMSGPFNLLDSGYAQLDGLFMLSPWVFLFLLPAIGMRMLAEERRTGTLEWLLTKPLRESQIILAKWIAGMGLVGLAILPTLAYAYSLYLLGNPIGNLDLGSMAGSYLGLLFLASVYLSVSLFTSAITDNPIVAFVLGMLFCLSLYAGFDQLATLSLLKSQSLFILNLGISEHYTSISRGVVDSRDVVYFVGLNLVFMAAARTALQSRNW